MMNMKTCLVFTAAAVAFECCVANVRVGFRETDGVNVGLGETSTFDGALLSLDFSGTQTVRRLVLGGVRHSGLVTAATDPEHLAGRGALLVEPKGLIFTFQ